MWKKFYEKFCESLREHTKNIIDFEKNVNLKNKELKSYQDPTKCYIYKKTIEKVGKDKNYQKVRDTCHYTGKSGKYRRAAHSICTLKFNMLNEIHVDFHNASNYDCDFIIKELAREFPGQF